MKLRRFSRIAVVALAFGTVLAAGGCGKKDDAKPGENGETITLRILENDTAKEKGYLDELLKAFNEAYKDKGIQAVDANMEEYSNLAENGPYGYGPDVLYQANDKIMTYAEDKHIMAIDVEKLDCYKTTPKEAFEAFNIVHDGKTYTCGVPVNVQEPMLFYREDNLPSDWKEKWDDNKNDVPDFFENWNDLYAYSKQLRDSDDSPNRDKKFGFMSSFNNLYLNAEFLFSYGGYVFGTDKDGSYNSKDIGFGKGDSAKGISGLIQFATLMNEGCIDDTITTGRYEKIANGTFFAAVSTPDTYALFVEKLALKYEDEGLSKDEALKKAQDNIKMIELPGLMPKDGDLTKNADDMSDSDFVKTVVMGGVNGYGISSYTKHRDACIEFVNFATSYDMISKRTQMLGIAPTRSDVASENGGVADKIFTSLKEGRIMLMPSIKAVDQIWSPVQTLMGDLAKDAFRKDGEKKYTDIASIQTALDKASQNVYDAIYTLAG